MKQRKAAALELELSGSEKDTFIVTDFGFKGRGVLNILPYKTGDAILCYRGDLLTAAEGKQRLEAYKDKAPLAQCYFFYFRHQGKQFCIDASSERQDSHGRLVNHSKKNANCVMKKTVIHDKPYLVLFALKNIELLSELLYDYGDRTAQSLSECPWLND